MTDVSTVASAAATTTEASTDASFDAILARVEASALQAAERNADTTIVQNETNVSRDTARSNRQ